MYFPTIQFDKHWLWEGGIQWVKHLIQEASSTQIADKVDKFHSLFWGKYYISWCFTEDKKSYFHVFLDAG